MKARMPAGFGRPDMNALMRQAQKMQEDMKAKQAELEAAEYTGSAAGEMVTVKMNEWQARGAVHQHQAGGCGPG